MKGGRLEGIDPTPERLTMPNAPPRPGDTMPDASTKTDDVTKATPAGTTAADDSMLALAAALSALGPEACGRLADVLRLLASVQRQRPSA